MTTLVQKVSGELGTRKLTDSKYLGLAMVPPEAEWFANILNANTRRAYRNDVGEFMGFIGITKPEEFRGVTRAHVIAWRDDVVGREYVKQKESTSSLFDSELEPEVEVKKTSAATVRRKLSALSSLFDYLCERNAVTHNPVKGVKRPNEGSNEGKTPALSDAQARHLLNAPDAKSLKGKRDRAMVAVLLFHGMRREEVVKLKVKDGCNSAHGARESSMSYSVMREELDFRTTSSP